MKKTSWVRTAVAVLAVTMALPAGAQLVQGKRGSDDFQIGIAGYTYRKFDIDQALKMAQQAGVKYMSIKDFHLPLASTAEEMAAFKQKLASYGIEGYILGPIYMKSKEQVDTAFDYVKRYGINMFIGVPDYELLPYVEKKVKDTGIKVAIHTHGPDNQAFPNAQEVVDRVKDPDKGIGICLDLGHSVRFGENNAEILKKYKEWIYDIHFKDESAASKEGKTWEMGRGVIDYRPIVQVLREIGYKGKICLEFEKNPMNPQPGVLESIGYFRGICDGTK